MPAISCSAPGKVILSGEHAVVYGKPAIAIPVLNAITKCTVIARPSSPSDESIIVAPDIDLKCSLSCLDESNPIRACIRMVLDSLKIDHLPVCEIQIHSTLPTAAGMGSSASTTVAVIRALSSFLGHPLENDEVNQIAFEIEKIHHGSPSGIDNTVITFGKPLFFIRDTPYEFLHLQKTLTFVIADSGIKSTTVKVVEEVKQGFLSDAQKYEQLFERIAEISRALKIELESGHLRSMGKLLTENHAALKEMGVSCPKLDTLVRAALEHGALGAKLSGSGQGGNMIALVDQDEAEMLAGELLAAGAVHTIITQVPAGESK